MTLKRPESVLVVLYSEDAQVLLLQRDDDADFWQSVTGTIEAGETPIQTAYREVAEETGLILEFAKHQIVDCRQINQYRIRKQWLHRYPEGTVYNDEHVFCAKVSSNHTITLTEHLSYQWMSKSDAIARAWSESNRLAIEKYVPSVL
ncbi:dihydroneopterin triphosphate diphosphatase [Glaciecola sp. XM2]|jgi:dATP pyrophosphohydrolase|uniref:dihydroneopterin triphosphate diphosphatase n=1 Tax=Glaciecola sp. XM2 TaxID=1914931 RepID=UPI001BDE9CD7|nr:dihydroneopterin triphosphate diphosphatase [Glaciecola sp. XM2]MBT1450023.1 dihydroneopterin triphosphate diphosphatase [Glaciecola sp. XM2]